VEHASEILVSCAACLIIHEAPVSHDSVDLHTPLNTSLALVSLKGRKAMMRSQIPLPFLQPVHVWVRQATNVFMFHGNAEGVIDRLFKAKLLH
jgi:hypothetical protein